MFTISFTNFSSDFASLPEPLRLGFIGQRQQSCLVRLTAEAWAFRAHNGSGPWHLGTLEEILPLIQELPIPEPYSPPEPLPAEEMSALVDDLISTLNL